MIQKLLFINVIFFVSLLTAWYGMGAGDDDLPGRHDKSESQTVSLQSVTPSVTQEVNLTPEVDNLCEQLTEEFLLANADHPRLKQYVKSQGEVELGKQITLFRSFRSNFSTYAEGILTAIDNGDLLINEQIKPGYPHYTPLMLALIIDRKKITVGALNQFFDRGSKVFNTPQWIGVTSKLSPEVAQAIIDRGLDPENTPTEWFRNEVSLTTQALLNGNLELTHYLQEQGYQLESEVTIREYGEFPERDNYTERRLSLVEFINTKKGLKHKDAILAYLEENN